MGRGFVVILFLGLITAVLILGGVYYVNLNINNGQTSRVGLTQNSQIISSPSINPTQSQTKDVQEENYINYRLPNGWKIQKEESLILSSKDYSEDISNTNFTADNKRPNGIKLTVSAGKNNNYYKSIDDILKMQNRAGIIGIEKTIIGGLSAVSYYEDYEGYVYKIEILSRDDIRWLFVFSADSKTDFETHQAEIDSFISSLTFK